MAGSVWPQDSLAMFQKSSVKMLTDIKAVNVNLTHPPAQDWTAAAVPWPCSPPGPSHTLPPHMTSPAYWPLKKSNKDECWVLTKPGRGTRAACPSHILAAVCQCRIHMSGAVVASDHHHHHPPTWFQWLAGFRLVMRHCWARRMFSKTILWIRKRLNSDTPCRMTAGIRIISPLQRDEGETQNRERTNRKEVDTRSRTTADRLDVQIHV